MYIRCTAVCKYLYGTAIEFLKRVLDCTVLSAKKKRPIVRQLYGTVGRPGEIEKTREVKATRIAWNGRRLHLGDEGPCT